MATPVTRLMLGRTSALSSISTSVASSSTLPLARRSLSTSPLRLEEGDKPSRFNLWSMLTRSGANKKATDPPPSSPSIHITSSGQSPYDKLPSVHVGPDAVGRVPPPPPTNPPPGSRTSAGAVEGESEGGKDGNELTSSSSDVAAIKDDPSQAYSASSKYYNPAWNVGAFGINAESTPAAEDTSALTPSNPTPTTAVSNLSYHSSLPAAPIHFPSIPSATPSSRRPQTDSNNARLPTPSLRLPRLVLSPKSTHPASHYFTTDLDERWKQLSLEFKHIHGRKPGDQFTGRTFEFAAGGVGKILGKFTSLVVRSNMRVEERRKSRFEHQPIQDWRLRRERHMRRFAVAMRRNVQIVHGLRMRGQSPVK